MVSAPRYGTPPKEAAESSLLRILEYYPSFVGAVVALSIDGKHGAACHGLETFPYVVSSPATGGVKLEQVSCIQSIHKLEL